MNELIEVFPFAFGVLLGVTWFRLWWSANLVRALGRCMRGARRVRHVRNRRMAGEPAVLPVRHRARCGRLGGDDDRRRLLVTQARTQPARLSAWARRYPISFRDDRRAAPGALRVSTAGLWVAVGFAFVALAERVTTSFRLFGFTVHALGAAPVFTLVTDLMAKSLQRRCSNPVAGGFLPPRDVNIPLRGRRLPCTIAGVGAQGKCPLPRRPPTTNFRETIDERQNADRSGLRRPLLTACAGGSLVINERYFPSGIVFVPADRKVKRIDRRQRDRVSTRNHRQSRATEAEHQSGR